KKSADQQVMVSPNPLEVHGDSVRFTVNAELPPRMMKMKVTYSLTPQFEYSGTVVPFTESITFNGDEINRKEAASQEETFCFPYRKGLANSQLHVTGNTSHKRSDKRLKGCRHEVTRRLVSTPKLVRIGQFAADEEFKPIGVYMDHGYAEQNELEPVEVQFFFEQGSSRRRPSEVNSDRGKFLKAFIASENVTRTVTITGTHSPEGSERVNRDLSKNRAEVIEK